MSASESFPLDTNLQESIEQLVAETVRRSQSSHDDEVQKLRSSLQTALNEIEAGQVSLQQAAVTLRSALENEPAIPASTRPVDDVMRKSPTPAEVIAIEPSTTSEPEVGPHEMDVIAHDVTIGIASSLQSLLRDRPEVKNAQTREFVNGELRLKLVMESGLDMSVLNEWITSHSGRITTRTQSVLELRFGD